jgi:hypothetical protein
MQYFLEIIFIANPNPNNVWWLLYLEFPNHDVAFVVSNLLSGELIDKKRQANLNANYEFLIIRTSS